MSPASTEVSRAAQRSRLGFAISNYTAAPKTARTRRTSAFLCRRTDCCQARIYPTIRVLARSLSDLLLKLRIRRAFADRNIQPARMAAFVFVDEFEDRPRGGAIKHY